MQFPLKTSVLADFIRELTHESRLAFAVHQHLHRGGRQGDLRSGHDSVRDRHVVGVTRQWSELDFFDVL